MTRITFLINSLTSGGAEKVMSVLLTELVRQSYSVELICLEKNTFYTIPDDVKVTYLSQSRGNENGIKKILAIPILARKLSRYIKRNDISLIQSHVYRSNYINVLAKLFGAKHTVQVVNAGRVSRYLEQGLLGKVNLLLIKHLYGKADLLISKAKGMQTDMQNLFHFTNEQIVINNPYDINKIEKLSFEEVTEFTFNNNKIYLVSVGRLISLKRNQDTLHALTKLPENVELLLLGEGNERNSLLHMAQQLGIQDRIHFMGRVSNPYKYVARSDIFVSASKSEGFPNVLVESMICGTPVVSSDCVSGPREILAPSTDIDFQLKEDIELGEYGILFPVADVESLAKAISTLLNDRSIKDQYIYKAKKRAGCFSVEKIIDQYKKVLGIE